MKEFLGEDFLLQSKTAVELYEKYAKSMPIIDYHCHIPAKEIAEDRRFENITELWLGADHYKWRLMRACGVDEELITGSASDHDKFIAFAGVLERAIGNPLYHWSHLELKRYFGYTGVLNTQTAEKVWELCNERLKADNMSARGLMKMSNVKLICTTDDPIDSLEYHEAIAADESFDIKVLPAFRPDKAIDIANPGFVDYIFAFSKCMQMHIRTLQDLKNALNIRIAYFADHGCKVADHGLKYVMYENVTEDEASNIFRKKMQGIPLQEADERKYQTFVQQFLCAEYAKRDWIVQLHYGVSRNNNTAMFEKLGPDTGFDCIGAQAPSDMLIQFLDSVCKTGKLPKTILYSLNPNDDAMIDTIAACFQDSSCIGKIQHGSAWWFNDHKDGMESHMKKLASNGMLANFIGMLTDSRSFVSYTRHEYFRRIFVNYIATLVENGEYPLDETVLGQIVVDVCYNNTKRYFGFDL